MHSNEESDYTCVNFQVATQANTTDSSRKKAQSPDPQAGTQASASSLSDTATSLSAEKTAITDSSRTNALVSVSKTQLPGYIQVDALQKEKESLPGVSMQDTLPDQAGYFGMYKALTKVVLPKTEIKKNYTVSVFKNHELSCTAIEPRFIAHNRQDWVLLLLIFFLALIGAIQYFYKKRFDMMTKAFFIQRFATQLVREENILNQRISILLNIVFVGIFSFFVYRSAALSGLAGAESPAYLPVFLATAGYFALKYYLNRGIGFLFLVEKEVREFVFNYFLINQYLGIALVCLGYWVAYASWGSTLALYLGWGAIGSAWLFQLYRGYSITSSNKRISKLYLFCYLCTLEILPIFLIGGFLRND